MPEVWYTRVCINFNHRHRSLYCNVIQYNKNFIECIPPQCLFCSLLLSTSHAVFPFYDWTIMLLYYYYIPACRLCPSPHSLAPLLFLLCPRCRHFVFPVQLLSLSPPPCPNFTLTFPTSLFFLSVFPSLQASPISLLQPSVYYLSLPPSASPTFKG